MFITKKHTENNSIAIEDAERGFRMEFSSPAGKGEIFLGESHQSFAQDGLINILDWVCDMGISTCLRLYVPNGENPDIHFTREPASVKDVFGIIHTSVGDALVVSEEDAKVLRAWLDGAIYCARGCHLVSIIKTQNGVHILSRDKNYLEAFEKIIDCARASLIKTPNGLHILSRDKNYLKAFEKAIDCVKRVDTTVRAGSDE